jgi:hypothetical protein
MYMNMNCTYTDMSLNWGRKLDEDFILYLFQLISLVDLTHRWCGKLCSLYCLCRHHLRGISLCCVYFDMSIFY